MKYRITVNLESDMDKDRVEKAFDSIAERKSMLRRFLGCRQFDLTLENVEEE